RRVHPGLPTASRSVLAGLVASAGVDRQRAAPALVDGRRSRHLQGQHAVATRSEGRRARDADDVALAGRAVSAVAEAAVTAGADVVADLTSRFPGTVFIREHTVDGVPTVWVPATALPAVIAFLKNAVARPYRMLFDLTAVDERLRKHRVGLPPSDFTI